MSAAAGAVSSSAPERADGLVAGDSWDQVGTGTVTAEAGVDNRVSVAITSTRLARMGRIAKECERLSVSRMIVFGLRTIDLTSLRIRPGLVRALVTIATHQIDAISFTKMSDVHSNIDLYLQQSDF